MSMPSCINRRSCQCFCGSRVSIGVVAASMLLARRNRISSLPDRNRNYTACPDCRQSKCACPVTLVPQSSMIPTDLGTQTPPAHPEMITFRAPQSRRRSIPPETATEALSPWLVGRADRCMRAGRVVALERRRPRRLNAIARLAHSLELPQNGCASNYGSVRRKLCVCE